MTKDEKNSLNVNLILDNIKLKHNTSINQEVEDVVWAKIDSRIASRGYNQPKSINVFWKYLAIAATVLLVLTFSLSLYFSTNRAEAELRLLANTTLNNQLYELPDKSTVLLRPGGQITYIYDRGFSRNITLNGEGFFDIESDKEHPFIIQTDVGSVRVIGTQFNLKSYSSQDRVELVLAKGIVQFERDNSLYKLVPNEQIVVEKQTGDVSIKAVDPKFYIAWKEDFFEFNNENILNILDVLSSIYRVKITLSDLSLAETHFTGKLNAKFNLDKILEDLCFIIDARYVEHNGEYFIKK